MNINKKCSFTLFKNKLLVIMAFYLIISLNEVSAQPYYYYYQTNDITLNANLIEFNLDNHVTQTLLNNVGRVSQLFWNSDQTELILQIKHSVFVIKLNTLNNKIKLLDGVEWILDMIDAPLTNKLYIATGNIEGEYKNTIVFDRMTNIAIDTIHFYSYYKIFTSEDENIFYKCIPDSSGIYFTAFNVLQKNILYEKRRCGTIGPFQEFYSLADARANKALTFINHTPESEFQEMVLCNPDSGIYFEPILINYPSRGYLSANTNLIIVQNEKENLNGEINVYKANTGELIKNYYLPPDGKILTYDNFPHNVYYVTNLSTQPEVYNLTQLKLDSLSVGMTFPYSSGINIKVKGKFFTTASKVYFNNEQKETIYISDSTLSFQLNPGDLSNVGNFPIWVSDYGSNSDTLMFSVVNTLPQTITPIVECVRNNGGNSYTAFFGCDNNNSVPVFVPIGTENQFTKTPEDRGQPTIFLPGRQSNVFSVDFDGRNMVWNLNGIKVTASKNSPSCP